MRAIVTIGLPSRAEAEDVLGRLEGIAGDGAVVFRTRRGRIKVLAVSDLVPASSTVSSGLLAGVVTLLVATALNAEPLRGDHQGGGERFGFDERALELVARRLGAGQAVCCLLVQARLANTIVAVLGEAGLMDVHMTSLTDEIAHAALEVTGA
jgi:hypothetical protein